MKSRKKRRTCLALGACRLVAVPRSWHGTEKPIPQCLVHVDLWLSPGVGMGLGVEIDMLMSRLLMTRG